MKKILSAFICVLVGITLFTGCSGTESNSLEESEISAAVSGVLVPITLDSIEDFHSFLLAARAFTQHGIMQDHGVSGRYGSTLNSLIRDRNFGYMDRYYIPAWVPEGFTLSSVRFNSGFIGAVFKSDDFDESQNSIEEHLLNNQITFSWFTQFPPPYAELFLYNETRALGLIAAPGVAGLYFHDFPAAWGSENLARTYYWIQDDYVFILSMPLWVINDRARMTPFDDSIADLVMNSALAVELVDGESYVEPTGIEIVAPVEDIPIDETLDLTANISPDNVTIDAVIWSSSDNNVATVTQSGVVRRVGEGTAIITARMVANNRLAATFELGGSPRRLS